MIRCLIIDDEPLAREVLEGFVARHESLELVASCSNAMEGFEVMHRERVRLIFLDIKMPGINGIDFLSALKDPPAVIFTTAFGSYALQGFDLEAVDYLLKPFTYERFEKGVGKLMRMQPFKAVVSKPYTYFRVSGKLVKVWHEQLLYVQSVKDYLLLCTTSGNYLTHMTMKHLVELLPPASFIRVHRSYVVNVGSVDELKAWEIVISGTSIPLGEQYRINLAKILHR
ncbi:LytTR family DNA-binding domain-containing protein [Pedobacter aquatilis]|uniref:LytR/AlgR family response regulator transcription factor n=1 Tax=Pedobacter aquatilis TaxID=351343 RepID=UPI00292DF5FC|nr:LytTR family DNA-binding domain-containing protein [Pedobacter aquatilis]